MLDRVEIIIIKETPELLFLGYKYVAVIFGGNVQHFVMENFKHTEKLKDFCNRHMYTHHLTSNISVHLLYHVIDPVIHP